LWHIFCASKFLLNFPKYKINRTFDQNDRKPIDFAALENFLHIVAKKCATTVNSKSITNDTNMQQVLYQNSNHIHNLDYIIGREFACKKYEVIQIDDWIWIFRRPVAFPDEAIMPSCIFRSKQGASATQLAIHINATVVLALSDC
jgi:hypothetical protein